MIRLPWPTSAYRQRDARSGVSLRIILRRHWLRCIGPRSLA